MYFWCLSFIQTFVILFLLGFFCLIVRTLSTFLLPFRNFSFSQLSIDLKFLIFISIPYWFELLLSFCICYVLSLIFTWSFRSIKSICSIQSSSSDWQLSFFSVFSFFSGLSRLSMDLCFYLFSWFSWFSWISILSSCFSRWKVIIIINFNVFVDLLKRRTFKVLLNLFNSMKRINLCIIDLDDCSCLYHF
jgi:hypothetical protein